MCHWASERNTHCLLCCSCHDCLCYLIFHHKCYAIQTLSVPYKSLGHTKKNLPHCFSMLTRTLVRDFRSRQWPSFLPNASRNAKVLENVAQFSNSNQRTMAMLTPRCSSPQVALVTQLCIFHYKYCTCYLDSLWRLTLSLSLHNPGRYQVLR